MSLSATTRRSSGGRPRALSAISTFSCTVSQGYRAKVWNTMVACGLIPTSGSPRYRTRPEVAGVRPVIMRSRVDLPQPDGPRRPTNSPGRIVRSTSRTATHARPPPAYSLPTPRSSSRLPLPETLMRSSSLHPIALFRQPVHGAPEGAVDQDDGGDEGQCRRQQQGIIAARGRSGDQRADADRGVRSPSELRVLGHDAGVPGPASRGDRSSHDIRKDGGKDEDAPA